jgi:hypothetical protein
MPMYDDDDGCGGHPGSGLGRAESGRVRRDDHGSYPVPVPYDPVPSQGNKINEPYRNSWHGEVRMGAGILIITRMHS